MTPAQRTPRKARTWERWANRDGEALTWIDAWGGCTREQARQMCLEGEVARRVLITELPLAARQRRGR